MIGKISDPREARVAGLLYYLFGPGRREEHTDPHLIAGWRDLGGLAAPASRDRPALPVPLLDELLSPFRRPADHPRWETRPKMISQIPPNKEEDPIRQVG